MAVGLWRQVASNSGVQVNIPSGNYLWPTIRVMNPNDGTVYIKQNAGLADSGYGSWDYKVPAQSFGLLPGEGVGWQSAGLYYQDQSGTGRPGEIAIYLSQQNVNEPSFVSIGRSLLSATTSVDVVEGIQPGNPASGQARLWIDTSDHLHILNSSGNDKVVLDSSNYSTYVNNAPVGGLFQGTVSNIQFKNQVYTFPSDIQARDIYAARTSNTGVVYFGTGTGNYLYWDGGTFQLTNAIAVSGAITGYSTLTISGAISGGSSLHTAGNIDTGDAGYIWHALFDYNTIRHTSAGQIGGTSYDLGSASGNNDSRIKYVKAWSNDMTI